MSEAPSPEWAELTALEHSRVNPYQTWCHDICFGAGVRERFFESHRGARDREYAFWTIPNLNSSSALTSFTSYDFVRQYTNSAVDHSEVELRSSSWLSFEDEREEEPVASW